MVPVLGWSEDCFMVPVMDVAVGVEGVTEWREAGEVGAVRAGKAFFFSGAGPQTPPAPLFRGGVHRRGAS